MAAVTGLTLIKRFTYRGDDTEEYSNTYHFKAQPPGDDASWMVVLTDLVNAEKLLVPSAVSFVRAYGYNSDDPHAAAVFEHDYTKPGPPPVGQYTMGSGVGMAGDQAALVWWRLDKKNTRGKWIYLRKYFHHGALIPGNPDSLDTPYFAVLQNFATTISASTFHGGMRPRAYDANVTASGASGWVTTRTLKRRGKRPRTPS